MEHSKRRIALRGSKQHTISHSLLGRAQQAGAPTERIPKRTAANATANECGQAQLQHRWVDAANTLRHNVGTEEVLPSYLRSTRVLFFALFAPAPDDDRQDDDCKNARHDTD